MERLVPAGTELSDEQLAHLVAALEAGGLALVPTETVYGVVARLDSAAGIAALREAKRRDADKPLQVLVADPGAARGLAGGWPAAAERLAVAYWPGPLTLVVPAGPAAPAAVRAADGTVGLRCPEHLLMRQILARTGPLAASSANLAGDPPAVTCRAAVDALGASAAVAVDGGGIVAGVPSSVVRVSDAGIEVLREGALSRAEVTRYG